MWRFEDVLSILMHVMLRKSVRIYREFAFVVVDMVSILSSVVRFSGLFLHRSANTVPGRYSPMSSMFVRHDRYP